MAIEKTKKEVPVIDGDPSIIKKVTLTATQKENENKRDLRKSQRADKAEEKKEQPEGAEEKKEEKKKKQPPETEQEKAQQAKAGAPMEGVSQSAGLTGGTEEAGSPPLSTRDQGQPAGKQQNQQQEKERARQFKGQNQQEKRTTAQPGGTEPKRGLVNRIKDRSDKKRDKRLEAAGRLPVAQRYRSYKRHLDEEVTGDKKKELKNKARQKIIGALARPSQQGTGHILKLAWLNLIDTFGLTWFYIAFHFLMAYFTPFSDLFCKFGQEWLPQSVKKGGGDAAKRAGKPLELLEILGCLFIGIIIFLIIGVIVLLVAIIVYAWANPLESLKLSWAIAWEVIKCWGGRVFGAGSC